MNQALLGDCLEIMPTLESGSVDCIITDLPYGTTACKWDTVIPFELLWGQYKRVVKPNGAIVLFGSEPFSSYLRLSNIDMYKYDLYWKKEKPTNIFQLKRRFGKSTETISIFYIEQPTYNPQMVVHTGKKVTNKPKGIHKSIVSGDSKQSVTPYNDTGFRYPIDVLEFRREVLGTVIHPTQKPVALIEFLIRTYTNECEIVLDSCAGSFTTAIACLNANRRYICIEKDMDYYSAGCKRIEQAQSQGTLFTADGLHLNEEE
jgi:DNA modification methylase